MRCQLLVFVLLLLAICADAKLIYLFSLIRHGALYPVKQIYNGAEVKRFRGNLTTVGMRQQYNLGTYLRAIYVDQERLISAEFNPKEVQYFSSSVGRTSFSAMSFIYGFFPLKQSLTLPEEITEDLLLPPYAQLFPDHLTSHSTQTKFLTPPSPHSTLNVLDHCQNYDNLIKISQKLVQDKLDALLLSQKAAIDRLAKTFRLVAPLQTTVNKLSALYKVVYADENLGTELPSNFTAEDRRSLDYIYKYFNSPINQDLFARYVSTPTLQFFGEKMRAASNKSRTTKMSAIFLHESAFWPYMYILNLTDPDCIEQQFKGRPVTSLNCVEDIKFCSSILFELHEDLTFKQQIKVKYNGKYVKLCERDDIECPAQEFLQRIKDKEIQYTQACKLLPNTPKPVHIRAMRIQ